MAWDNLTAEIAEEMGDLTPTGVDAWNACTTEKTWASRSKRNSYKLGWNTHQGRFQSRRRSDKKQVNRKKVARFRAYHRDRIRFSREELGLSLSDVGRVDPLFLLDE